jgi:hypothetical protein
MDLIVSLPVRRATVVVAPSVVAALGTAVLAASVMAGTALGVRTVELPEEVSVRVFFPGAVNLFFMTFCLTAVTALVSSFGRDRWQTIAIAGGFFAVSWVIKMIGRVWSSGWWLQYCTFLGAYHPQRLILMPEESRSAALTYNGTLLAAGLACYALAVVVFSFRDVPAAR